MKIKEISVNLSAVIPTGSYQNYKPTYEIKADIVEDENPQTKMEELRDLIRKMFVLDWTRLKEKDKVEYLSKCRFYLRERKKLPSVTSIIGWADLQYQLRNPEKFYDEVGEDDLQEYAARGTVVHKGFEKWFLETGGKFPTPSEYEFKIEHPELVVEKQILSESRIDPKACNFLNFWQKYGGDIQFDFVEKTVYDKQYAGTLDAYGKYKGELAIFDIKTTSNYTPRKELSYFKQMAAYAHTFRGTKKPKWLVIIPLNPTNKCGFSAPKIEMYSENLYRAFEEDLKRFNRDFSELL